MTESQKLLSAYVARDSEDAFHELVTRYAGLVYSTAVRMVSGDAHLAQDVAQTVFFDLSQSAKTLSREVHLGGWLHRHTCFVSSKLMRTERRRQAREMQAEGALAGEDHSAANLADVTPYLDEAIEQLALPDRTAIMLRFFEQKDFRAVGEALGSNESAAQKKVSRALDKLHRLMKRRGCTLSLAALTSFLTASVAAAPAGVAAAIAAADFAGQSITAASIAATTAKTIIMTTLQKTLVGGALALVVGAGMFQARKASRLEELVQALQGRQQSMAGEIQLLQRERDDATNRLAAAPDQLAQSSTAAGELLRLRGEVTRLRRDSQELAALKAARANDTSDLAEEESWLKRIQWLKQRLAQTPSAQSPELEFLEKDDWLMVAKERKLETDEDYRAAFSDLHSRAEGNVLGLMEKALRKYLEANHDEFPTEVLQLKPFFASAPADELLQRFKIVPANEVPQADITNSSRDWLIVPKAPMGGGLWALGRTGQSGLANSTAMDVLAPAIKALLEAAPVINGKKQVDIHQLGPYLSTPEQKAAYEELINQPK